MAKYWEPRKYHKRYKPVHGFLAIDHPAYSVWHGIKSRCLRKNDPNFYHYGGRGIIICDRWLDSFENFALDMGLPPFEDYEIDRIDNNKGYYPENCRWANGTTQCLNRRIFKNNMSTKAGVQEKNNKRFLSQIDLFGKRYNLGRFDSLESAEAARIKFLKLFEEDRPAALAMTERRARYDSSTGIRGISKHTDGFIVRKTINKERVYLGFRKTFEEALELWNQNLNE